MPCHAKTIHACTHTRALTVVVITSVIPRWRVELGQHNRGNVFGAATRNEVRFVGASHSVESAVPTTLQVVEQGLCSVHSTVAKCIFEDVCDGISPHHCSRRHLDKHAQQNTCSKLTARARRCRKRVCSTLLRVLYGLSWLVINRVGWVLIKLADRAQISNVHFGRLHSHSSPLLRAAVFARKPPHALMLPVVTTQKIFQASWRAVLPPRPPSLALCVDPHQKNAKSILANNIEGVSMTLRTWM